MKQFVLCVKRSMHVCNALTVVQMQFTVGCAALKSMILIGIFIIHPSVGMGAGFLVTVNRKAVLSDHSCPSTCEEKITIIASNRVSIKLDVTYKLIFFVLHRVTSLYH